MTILLDKVRHKKKYKTTTSKQFKSDIFDRFQNLNLIIELGIAQGDTTYVLSHLADKVIAIDNQQANIDYIKQNTCKDRNNIEYIQMDLYRQWNINYNADLVIIDAVHLFSQVISDINNTIQHLGKPTIILHDWGLSTGQVKKAVNEFVDTGMLEIIEFIGADKEELNSYGGVGWHGPEAVICKII